MKILISGATGLIGSTLAAAWRSQGHQVIKLIRDPAQMGVNTLLWLPPEKGPVLNDIEGVDAVIHLAGESIAAGRWTKARKAAIYSSRIDSTHLLAQLFVQMKTPPKVWICASAIGFYGDRGDTLLTEHSPVGRGFLPDVCMAWEKATQPAKEKGIRVVNLRTGIVLSLQGGALQAMKRPFQWGIGGPIGSGHQYMSWITLEDVCGIVRYVLNNACVSGPVNLVAPTPVTNQEFTMTLAKVLHRPAFLRLPSSVARFALGEMADALLLASLRVQPEVLQQTGYRFLFPELSGALIHLLRP